MSRPPLVVRPASLHVHLPQDLMARLSLHLYSQSEGRIPKGAFQKLFTELLTDYLKDKSHANVP